jgi:hypothetical protein
MLCLRSYTDAAVRPYPSCQLIERVLYLEPLRKDVLYEMVGNPETLLVDSTLLSVLHPLLRSLRARDSPGRRG